MFSPSEVGGIWACKFNPRLLSSLTDILTFQSLPRSGYQALRPLLLPYPHNQWPEIPQREILRTAEMTVSRNEVMQVHFSGGPCWQGTQRY